MRLKQALLAIAIGLGLPAAAWAQSATEVGQRLVDAAGAPGRFQSAADSQHSVRILDTQSGLRCSIPINAPHMTLRVNGVIAQCGYTGAIQEMWAIIPASAPAAQRPLDDFAAGFALAQIDSTPTLQVIPSRLAPAPLPGVETLFPNAPQPFRIWLKDSRPNTDLMVSIAVVDMNGHRLIHWVTGAADPVTALSQLSFLTSTSPSPGTN